MRQDATIRDLIGDSNDGLDRLSRNRATAKAHLMCPEGPRTDGSYGVNLIGKIDYSAVRVDGQWCSNESRLEGPNLEAAGMIVVWVSGRPRGAALWPGVPGPPTHLSVPLRKSRHRLDDFRSVHVKPILGGGLHHEYSLARAST